MIGCKIITLESVGSTNEYLKELIEKENIPEEGTIFRAIHQTSGRGLDKNRWESQAGQNLTFSLYLEPRFLSAEKQFYLNMSISLGLHDFVDDIIKGEKITIKWPNDIYINSDKVAGILIHHAVSARNLLYSIIGIGININQTSFSNHLPNPVSLNRFTHRKLEPDKSLSILAQFLEIRYKQLKDSRTESLKHDYMHHLFGFEQWRSFRYNGRVIRAKIIDVNRFGLLQLETEVSGVISCDMKEIAYIL